MIAASPAPSPRKKLRVAHVITNLTTGGAEWMLLRLCEAMDRTRFEAEVFSLRDVSVMGAKLERAGIRVRALGIDPRRPNPLSVWRLARWLRDGKFDVVQTWMTHADLLGGAAARLAGLPVAWGIHVGHIDPATHGRVALWTARLNARLSRFVPSKIVCCSELSRKVHEELGYARDKMVVIPNGFPLDAFKPDRAARWSVREELGLDPDAILVGQVGRFHKQKDHATFCRAAHSVLARRPDVHFVLCGRDVTPDNRELADLIGDARARFHVLGERSDVARLTASFDLACSSSSFGEAFPLVIGEAMACAVPCVVTDCGDSALMLGATGRVVPIRDPSAFAAAVEELLALPAAARAELGAAARARVAENYSLAKVTARYHQLYESLVPGFSA